MRGRCVALFAALVLGMFGVFVFACVGDDPSSTTGPVTEEGGSVGGEGQPCFANMTCNEGLTCVGQGTKVCIRLDGSTSDSDAGVDAPTDGPTSDDAADAGPPFTGMLSPTCLTGGNLGDGGIVTLDQSQSIFALALDCTNVYWVGTNSTADGGAVWKCPLTGCAGAPTALVSGLNQPAYIALDPGTVYFTTVDGRVLACGKNGCSNNPFTLASAQNFPAGIAVDATNVYWVNSGAGEVMKCAKTGCNNTPTVLAENVKSPFSVATDGKDVYWTEGNLNSTAAVWKCATAGCNKTPTPVAPAGAASAVVVDLTNFYFVTPGNAIARVSKCAKATGCGGTPTNLVTGLNVSGSGAISVDGTNLYYAADGVVGRCAIAGCNQTPFIIEYPAVTVFSVAVNGDSLYYDRPPTIRRVSPK